MPQRTRSGSTPTMLLRSRGPSSSSITATTYGMSSAKAGWYARWKTTKLCTRPRPPTSLQPVSADRQWGQRHDGGNQDFPHALQLGISSLCCRAAFQNLADSGEGAGKGREGRMRDSDASIRSAPSQNERGMADLVAAV